MTSLTPTTALLFPGQGSHSQGMEEPYRDHPLLQRGIELLGFDPFSDIDGGGTRSHQPALFLCSIAQWDSEHAHAAESEPPLAAAGHSLGEYAALTAAGAIVFDDAIRLVGARSQAMALAADMQDGGMVAILGGERDDVLGLAEELELSLANDNAPGQIVLSGAMDRVDEAAQRAGDVGARASKLAVGGGRHQRRAVRRSVRRARREPAQAGSLRRVAARAAGDGRRGVRRVRSRQGARGARQAHAEGDRMTTRQRSTAACLDTMTGPSR